jgi:hypothetical protein
MKIRNSIVLAIGLGILTLSSPLSAQTWDNREQETQKLLGAIAGGYLGSTIGDGDGRRAATVLGATLGYKYGDIILRSPPTRSQRNAWDVCKKMVPAKYRGNSGATRSWVEGCVARIEVEQYKLESEAYQDGLEIR